MFLYSVTTTPTLAIKFGIPTSLYLRAHSLSSVSSHLVACAISSSSDHIRLMRNRSTSVPDISTPSTFISPQNPTRSNSTQCLHVPERLNLQPLSPTPLRFSEGRNDTWSRNYQKSRKAHGQLFECIRVKRNKHTSPDDAGKMLDGPRTVQIRDKLKQSILKSAKGRSWSKKNKANREGKAERDKGAKTERKNKKSASGGIAWG